MALSKSERVPERLFTSAMWAVSIIFAGFLIGFGNLVLGDLPQLDGSLTEEQFVDAAGLARLRGEAGQLSGQTATIDSQLEVARLQLEQAQTASATGQETFDAWVRTRTATTNPQQDSELLARTRALEALKDNERRAQEAIDQLNSTRLDVEQRANTNESAQQQLRADAYPAYEKALFWQELKVFSWRLLFTLPLLLLSGWLILRKRSSDYWPLMRGFVLASAFAFFVELVPYLPSYGGYIRYIVGIVLTGVVGHFLIRNMRAYLARRQAVEVQNEEERRKLVSHEEAFKKMAARVCPGCDRPVATTGEAEINYCVHCGMTLFNRCPSCDTRKMAFFRYCMTCGTTADSHDHPAHVADGGTADSRPPMPSQPTSPPEPTAPTAQPD